MQTHDRIVVPDERFRPPSKEEISSLRPGDFAKLIFTDTGEPDVQAGKESMWVKISETTDGEYVGELDNDPTFLTDLKCGEPVKFLDMHVLDLLRAN